MSTRLIPKFDYHFLATSVLSVSSWIVFEKLHHGDTKSTKEAQRNY